jgi:hypothetical protein
LNEESAVSDASFMSTYSRKETLPNTSYWLKKLANNHSFEKTDMAALYCLQLSTFLGKTINQIIKYPPASLVPWLQCSWLSPDGLSLDIYMSSLSIWNSYFALNTTPMNEPSHFCS